MSKVFVLDTFEHPLNPIHPGEARRLLSQGKAAVFRHYPFSIILKRAIEQPEVKPLRIKLDPGSRTTGIALVNDASGEVVFAAELSHRGHQVKAALDDRRSVRRSRRNRKTRYRKPRWHNRKRKAGWLCDYPRFQSPMSRRHFCSTHRLDTSSFMVQRSQFSNACKHFLLPSSSM